MLERDLFHLHQVLPAHEQYALDSTALHQAWTTRYGKKSFRSLQRYLLDCSGESDDRTKLAVRAQPKSAPGKSEPLRGYKYFRNPNFNLTRASADSAEDRKSAAKQILDQLAGTRRPRSEAIDTLSSVVSLDPDVQQRLRKGIRFVDDWIGRERATIQAEVFETCVTCLGEARPFTALEHDRHGHESREVLLSPHGLVSKDGTTYLVAADRVGTLGTYALHRLSNPRHSVSDFKRIDGFDLDAHIRKTHNFCHPVNGRDELIRLVIRVAPETIYHFKERPLALGQDISGPGRNDDWYTVAAEVPVTILLVPFLLSMGHWIAVVGPDSLVAEMALRAHGMAGCYPPPTALPPSPFGTGAKPWSLGHEA